MAHIDGFSVLQTQLQQLVSTARRDPALRLRGHSDTSEEF